MMAGGAPSLSRPVGVGRITEAGIEVEVVADEAERAALAAEFGLAAIHALQGKYRLRALPDRYRVEGRVTARVVQTCVVSLEPFDASVDEAVLVDYAEPDERRQEADEDDDASPGMDAPDELTGDAIDVGAITAEFLSLGLDPYPHKPGAVLEQVPESGPASPFAALARLKVKGSE